MNTGITFGPVPSRRLGRSLGINNIVAPKVCSYACVYCQVGKTAVHTAKKQAFYGPEEIFAQVRRHLMRIKDDNLPDYITFVANGEPTLDINLLLSINRLKTFGIPVAVITNATMMHDAEVVEALLEADWVSVKVDAADEDTWRRINLPVKTLDFDVHLASISAFAEQFAGTLCTETMIVAQKNDSDLQIQAIADFVMNIEPSVAYLSVPTRPPAVKSVKTPNEEQLAMAWDIFTSHGMHTEFLTGFEGTSTGFTGHAEADILGITAVHPLRHDMLAELLRNDKAGFEVVESLLTKGILTAVKHKSHIFYLRTLKKN